MEGIELDDIFEGEETTEPTEEIEIEESEDISDEQTNEDEVIDDDSEEVEEVEDVRDLKAIEIKFQDDEAKNLGDFTDEEIQKYHQLGRKAEFQIEKANVKAKDTVLDFEKLAGLYDMDLNDFVTQLKDNIFTSKSEEVGGKDEGRHVDDIKKEYESNNKSFKERSIGNLLDEYPDLTSDTIPKEVLEDLKFGKDITASYEKHLLNNENNSLKDKIAKLEKDLKTINQNKKAKSKAFVKKGSGQTGKGVSTLMSEIDKILS